MTAHMPTMPATAGAFTREQCGALAERLAEADWLRARREQAWQRLQDMGPLALPTDKGQKTLPPLPIDQLNPLAPAPADAASPTSQWGAVAAGHWSIDGHDVHSGIEPEWLEKGLIFTDLATAAREHPDLVKKYLKDAVPDRERAHLIALNEAFRTAGRFVYVPRNLDVTLPVSLGHTLQHAGLSVCPYTLIVLESGARLTLVEDVQSPAFEGLSLFNAMTDIHLGAGAHLTHYHLESWERNVYHYLQQRAWLDRDASFTTFSALIGGQLTYSYNETNMVGPGSEGVVLGLIYGDYNQSFLARTVQNHIGPHTTSDLVVKAVLKGSSHSDYSGWITIEKDAVKTEAQQTQRNLLLSQEARADSIPNLEILTNDVKCAHAAAVGPIDEEQLFYLRSRGLAPAAAEAMVVQGFVEDVVLRIKQQQMQDRIRRALRARLGFADEDDA